MTDYALLVLKAREIIAAEPWYVAACSNLSALIMDALPNLNWAGFYLMRDGKLTVGPFQGKPACIHIVPGKGVCGTALSRNETLVVPDVHQFPGHIACDAASASEIVVPLHAGEKAVAVLDIDSPVKNRFSPEDRAGLEALAAEIDSNIRWS